MVNKIRNTHAAKSTTKKLRSSSVKKKSSYRYMQEKLHKYEKRIRDLEYAMKRMNGIFNEAAARLFPELQ